MEKTKDRYTGKLYNKLYEEKPYSQEVDRILPYIYGKSVIDIGGGNGGHSAVLRDRGFIIKIVDISPSMLAIARAKGLDAELGDFDSYSSNEKYDTAISMFHVMNFSQNLEKTFRNIRALLVFNGVFIFDFWNNTVKKEGFSFRWEGILTRFIIKKWNGDTVRITFIFPFLLKRELHVLYCPHKDHVIECAQKVGFKITEVQDDGLEYLFILHA